MGARSVFSAVGKLESRIQWVGTDLDDLEWPWTP